MGTPIRVMLVGEYRVALFGLDRLVNERRPAMQIVATATSCALACTLAEQLLPDVVVIDPEHGCENVGEVIPTLVADYGARVLMLVGQRDQSFRETAMGNRRPDGKSGDDPGRGKRWTLSGERAA